MSINIIRKACESDLQTLVEYNQALAKETENLFLDKNILKLGLQKATKLKGCYYFFAEIDSNIVGQSMITSEWSEWSNLVVPKCLCSPRLQGQGCL